MCTTHYKIKPSPATPCRWDSSLQMVDDTPLHLGIHARNTRRPTPSHQAVQMSVQQMNISKDDAPRGWRRRHHPIQEAAITPPTRATTPTGAAVNGGLPYIWGFPQKQWSERRPHHRLQRGIRHPQVPPSMVVSSPASASGPPSPPHRGPPHPTGQAIRR
jgi:hypothetical protein